MRMEIAAILKARDFKGDVFANKQRSALASTFIKTLTSLPMNSPVWTARGTCIVRVSETKFQIGTEHLNLKPIRSPFSLRLKSSHSSATPTPPATSSSPVDTPAESPRNDDQPQVSSKAARLLGTMRGSLPMFARSEY